MRKVLLYVVIIAALSSCRNNYVVYSRLVTIDSLLRNEQTDSALQMIENLRTSDYDEETRAYYHLLLSQARYKAYRPTETDSVIKLAVDYYKKIGDDRKLSQSLLYHGCILRELGKQKDALEALKAAEHAVGTVDDEVLRHNIFFHLASLNSYFDEKQLALHYIWKAIQCTQKTGKSDHLAYDYQSCSIYHYNMGNDDSCRYYIDKCFALIDRLPQNPPSIRAKVWKSLGFAYISVDKVRSKLFLEKSVALVPSGEAYGALARLYLEMKDTSLAVELLTRSINDTLFPLVQMGNIQLLSRVEQERGNYKRAAELSRKALALKDTIARRQQEENVRALQMEIDHKQEREESEKTKMWLLAGIGVVVVAGVGIVAVMMGRARRHRKQIDEEQQQIATLESENRMVNRELGKAQKTVSRMKREKLEQDKAMRGLQKEWQQHEQAISRGSQLYMELKSGGKIISWTRDDMRCLRAYYDSVDKAFAEEIARKYGQLSPNQYLLALLEHWGKSDDEIMTMMSLSRGALRTSRTRLNQNQNDE